MHTENANPNKIIARNIKQCRKKACLTQQYVAEKIFCSLKTYQKLEAGTGSFSIDMLQLLAAVLSIPIEDLLEGILSKPEKTNHFLFEAAMQNLY